MSSPQFAVSDGLSSSTGASDAGLPRSSAVTSSGSFGGTVASRPSIGALGSLAAPLVSSG